MYFLMVICQTKMLGFRDKKFTFDVSSTAGQFTEGETMIRYPVLEKKYPNFSVTVEPGQIRKGEVLGIMGANALGKTTMMKMIAGAEKTRFRKSI